MVVLWTKTILEGEVERWKSAHDSMSAAFAKANTIIDELRRNDLGYIRSNNGNGNGSTNTRGSPSRSIRSSSIHSAPLPFPDLRAANREIQKLTMANARLLERCKAAENDPLRVRSTVTMSVCVSSLKVVLINFVMRRTDCNDRNN